MPETVDPPSSEAENKQADDEKFQPYLERVQWNRIEDHYEKGNSSACVLHWADFSLEMDGPSLELTLRCTEDEGARWWQGDDDHGEALPSVIQAQMPTEADKEIMRHYLEQVNFQSVAPCPTTPGRWQLNGRATILDGSIGLLNLEDYASIYRERGSAADECREFDVSVIERDKPGVGTVLYWQDPDIAGSWCLVLEAPTGILESLHKECQARPNRAVRLYTRMLLWETEDDPTEFDYRLEIHAVHFAVLDAITLIPQGGEELARSDYEEIRRDYFAHVMGERLGRTDYADIRGYFDEPKLIYEPEYLVRCGFKFSALLDEMTLAIAAYCYAARENSTQCRERLKAARTLLEEFSDATNPPASDREQSKPEHTHDSDCVWRHRNLAAAFVEGFQSKEAVVTDLELLQWVAHSYLRQPWLCPLFEHAMLDALVATEIYRFGEEVKRCPSGPVDLSRMEAVLPNGSTLEHELRSAASIVTIRDQEIEEYKKAKGKLQQLRRLRGKRAAQTAMYAFSSRILFFLVAPAFGIWFAFDKGYSLTGFIIGCVWIALLGLGFLTVLIRSLTRNKGAGTNPPDKFNSMLSDMWIAYQQLSGFAFSPDRVREVLAVCASKGAGWPPETFALLDATLKRDGA
jgi:hypothetical protein